MKKREDKPITKHTLNLYAGDYAKIQGLYPPRMGAGKIIRELVHAHIRKIEESAAQRVDLIESLDIEMENNDVNGTL